MKCKYCFAELEDDVTVCSVCGKDLEETEEVRPEETEEVLEEETLAETEEDTEEDEDEYEEIVIRRKKKKKMPKALAVTLAALGSLVLVVALFLAVLYGMGFKLSSIGAFLGLKEAGVDYKSSYSVSDQKVEKMADEVIAKVGDQTLTNEQLQVYYWMTVRDYVAQYEYAISLGGDTELGFDLDKPLSKQVYDVKTGETYEQYFLKYAIESWRRYVSFVQMAEDSDYVLDEDIQEYLDTYGKEMESLAQEAGYDSAEALVDDRVSKGSSVATYYDYVCTEYTALGYLQSREDDLAPTEQELEDYYTAHADELDAAGYGKDAGKYYDVRHIFVTVEGEMGENGYTDAQWEACRAKAQKLLDDFLANEPTEEKFAELATENSEDPGSAANGGLYANLSKGAFGNETFDSWYADENRKPGDTGLVKNTVSAKVGYHVMYFSDSREIWKDQAETMVMSEKVGELLEQAEAQYPMTVNYKKIVLGKADLTTEE